MIAKNTDPARAAFEKWRQSLQHADWISNRSAFTAGWAAAIARLEEKHSGFEESAQRFACTGGRFSPSTGKNND